MPRHLFPFHATLLLHKENLKYAQPLLTSFSLSSLTHITHFHMATALSVRPSHAISGSDRPGSTSFHREPVVNALNPGRRRPGGALFTRRMLAAAPLRASRADDSAPSEMSVENALKLLGVSEGASFDDILRAKNSILAACKDDQEAILQVIPPFHELARIIGEFEAN